jgi:hypothetical protein
MNAYFLRDGFYARPSFWRMLFLTLIAVITWLVLARTFAHAQTAVVTAAAPSAAPVAIPYGDWIASLLSWARDFFIALAMGAVVRFMPAALQQYLTNQVLAKAVDYAIAAVDGAVKGQSLSLPVTTAVLSAAENYVVASAPALAAKLGPLLRAKLLARVSAASPVASNVTAASVGASLPPVPIK